MNIAANVGSQQTRVFTSQVALRVHIEQWLASHAWVNLSERRLLAAQALAQLTTVLQTDSGVNEGECHRMLLQLISTALHTECCSTSRLDQEYGFGDLAQYLLRIARFKSDTDDLAEEAVNTTLLTLWKSRTTIKQPAAFLAYAKISLVREIWRLSRLHRANTSISLEEPVGGENDSELGELIPDETLSTEAKIENQDTNQHLRSAIQASELLTARDKAVIILMWIEDYSQSEICQQLNMKPGALYTLLSRLRAKISKDLTLMELLGNLRKETI